MQKFNKRHTFALRKLSMGVSSIMIASGLFMLARQDGQAAENGNSHDAQVAAQQQDATLTQPKETNEAPSPSDATSLNEKPDTSEAPLAKQSSTQSSPSDNSAPAPKPTEVDNEKTPDTLPQTSPTTEQKKQNSEATLTEKGDSQIVPAKKPELDSEFSVVDRQDKDKKTEEQKKPAKKPELDPEFSVVNRQDKDKKPKKEKDK